MLHTSCSAVKPLETCRPSTWPSIVRKNSLRDLLSSFTGFMANLLSVKWWLKMRQGGPNSH